MVEEIMLCLVMLEMLGAIMVVRWTEQRIKDMMAENHIAVMEQMDAVRKADLHNWQAIEDMQKKAAKQVEDEQPDRDLNEGFENLMRFSVKGMDGFGGDRK